MLVTRVADEPVDARAVGAGVGELARVGHQLVGAARRPVEAALLEELAVPVQARRRVAHRDRRERAVVARGDQQVRRDAREVVDRRLLLPRVEWLEQRADARRLELVDDERQVDRGLAQRQLAEQAIVHGLDVGRDPVELDVVPLGPVAGDVAPGGARREPARHGLVHLVREHGQRGLLRARGDGREGEGGGAEHGAAVPEQGHGVCLPDVVFVPAARGRRPAGTASRSIRGARGATLRARAPTPSCRRSARARCRAARR